MQWYASQTAGAKCRTCQTCGTQRIAVFLSSKRHPAESVADTSSQKAAIVPFFFFFGSAGSDPRGGNSSLDTSVWQ